MNIELFKSIKNVIETEPESYKQSRYGNTSSYRDQELQIDCNTPGCIAGHAVAITRTPVKDENIRSKASKVLGISLDERMALFHTSWSESWVKGDGPLPIGNAVPNDNLEIVPDAKDAIQVLNRLIKHGFTTEAQPCQN